jgi:hypothetical protein
VPAVIRRIDPHARSSLFIVARGDARAVSAGAIRHAVADIDPTEPVADMATMSERAAGARRVTRTSLIRAGTLALLAMTLAAVGLYGVISVGIAPARPRIWRADRARRHRTPHFARSSSVKACGSPPPAASSALPVPRPWPPCSRRRSCSRHHATPPPPRLAPRSCRLLVAGSVAAGQALG